MPNTNFQTFHQMGQAINEVVRQATGRDRVQNIDMDHVTVAQNSYYEEVTASGSMVSFIDRVGNTPLEKCVVQIEPVQDLHGYDSPWPAGGGKNLLNPTGVSGTDAGVTYTKGTDGKWTSSGTASGTSVILTGEFDVKSGVSYTLNGCPSGGGPASYRIDVRTAPSSIYNDWIDIGSGMAFTPSEDAHLYVYIRAASGTNMEGKTFSPMIRLASESDATFSPYSNICPISGWTGAKVTRTDSTFEPYQGETYDITFPSEAGTVYGGTLDAVSGVLVVDRMNIASYNGETLPGKWISDRDVYVDGATPTTGAQVVYELAEPITYQLTQTEITTLTGSNNIWADTGNIEVTYKVLKELY